MLYGADGFTHFKHHRTFIGDSLVITYEIHTLNGTVPREMLIEGLRDVIDPHREWQAGVRSPTKGIKWWSLRLT